MNLFVVFVAAVRGGCGRLLAALAWVLALLAGLGVVSPAAFAALGIFLLVLPLLTLLPFYFFPQPFGLQETVKQEKKKEKPRKKEDKITNKMSMYLFVVFVAAVRGGCGRLLAALAWVLALLAGLGVVSPAGDDAEDFRPERWLDGTLEAKVGQKAFLPFAAGSRNCIGKDFAWHEITIMTSVLARNFAFKFPPNEPFPAGIRGIVQSPTPYKLVFIAR